MRFIIFFILFFPYSSFSQNPNITPEQVIIKMENSIKNFNSISYKVKMKSKRFGHSKFNTRFFEVDIFKNKKNRGYYFDWKIKELKNEESFIHIFIEKKFYMINEEKKRVVIQENVQKLDKGSYSEGIRQYVIFDEIIYKIKVEDKKKIKFSSENNQMNCWILDIPTIGGNHLIWIDKKSHLPFKKKTVFKNGNIEAVHIIEIDSTILNKVDYDVIFDMKKYEENFQVKHIAKNEKNENISLSDLELDLTPNQIDTLLNTVLISTEGKKIKLAELESNFILMDFWFIACIPCLNSMPEFQKLHNKFSKTDLHVVGINWVDNKIPEERNKILKDKKLTYTHTFTKKTLGKTLKINAFPTVILMKKSGQVIYAGYFLSSEHIENLIFDNM